jgi:hypothetical protein
MDLGELGELCVGIDSSLESLCRTAERLTVFAWTFRYPGDAVAPRPRRLTGPFVWRMTCSMPSSHDCRPSSSFEPRTSPSPVDRAEAPWGFDDQSRSEP